MLTLPAQIQANLDAGADSSRLLVKFDLDGGAQGLWNEAYDATVDGTLYQGIGNNLAVEAFTGATALSVQTVTLSMSNLESDVTAIIDQQDWHQRGVTLFIGHLDDAGQVLATVPRFSGFLDEVTVIEKADGLSQVLAKIESTSRGFARTGTRTRADADQRSYGSSTDGFFKHTAQATTQPIFWGRKGPQHP